jgi:hypothetical protein
VPFLWLYVAGVAIGLAVMRDPPLPRLFTALVWPLGPAAFLVVVPALLVLATIAWPLRMLPVVAVVAILTWLLM